MTIISLFPGYDIFISHFICTYTLSLLLLARELFAHFCCNYVRLHFLSNRTTLLCLPHNLSLGLSILRHFLFMAPFRKTLEWQTPTICLINFTLFNWTCSINWCLLISSVPILWNTTLALLGSDSPAYLVLELTNLSQYKFNYCTSLRVKKGANLQCLLLIYGSGNCIGLILCFTWCLSDRSLDYGLRKTPSLT